MLRVSRRRAVEAQAARVPTMFSRGKGGSSEGPRWRLRGPSRLPLMRRLPFTRMQLWTFPSQKDNEVSSVWEWGRCLCGEVGGWGRGVSRGLNPGFVGGRVGEHLWRCLLCWPLTGSLGCLVTNLTWAKTYQFSQRNVISWQFAASEKRSLLGIVEKASVARQLASSAIISQQSGTKSSLLGRRLLTEETLSSPVFSLFTSLKRQTSFCQCVCRYQTLPVFEFKQESETLKIVGRQTLSPRKCCFREFQVRLSVSSQETHVYLGEINHILSIHREDKGCLCPRLRPGENHTCRGPNPPPPPVVIRSYSEIKQRHEHGGVTILVLCSGTFDPFQAGSVSPPAAESRCLTYPW